MAQSDVPESEPQTGVLQQDTTGREEAVKYKTIREGAVEIIAQQVASEASINGDPEGKHTRGANGAQQTVFYNPIQQFNRDLSVLAIRAFAEDWQAIAAAKHKRSQEAQQNRQAKSKKRKREPESTLRNDGQSEARHQASAGSQKEGSTVTVSEAAKLNENLGETAAVDDAEPDPDPLGGVLLLATDEEAKGPAAVVSDQPHKGAQAHPAGPLHTGTSRPFRVLDALSATGLRALRYAKEIPLVTTIVANDLSPAASEAIKLNVDLNNLSAKVSTNMGDAIDHMRQAARHDGPRSRHYHVIDLDPYGTAAPFLDAAVQAVVDGGLLCVTCTDAGVFASLGYLEKTYSQYRGLPVKGPHAHEVGLRLILNAIATSAARYGLAIEPLLSLSIDYYARVFVRVRRSPADVKFLVSKTMLVYGCDHGCGAWETQFLARANPRTSKKGEILYNFTSGLGPSADHKCAHCGFRTHIAGPMWGGALHNPFFIQRILSLLTGLDSAIYGTIPRIEGMLSTALEEPIDYSFGNQTKPKDSGLDQNLSDEVRKNAEEVSDQATGTDSPAILSPFPATPPEFRASHPFFIVPSNLARVLNATTPSDSAIRGALRHLGYRATRSHTKAGSITTDAPWTVIWEIMREHVRQSGTKNLPKQGTAGWGIMQKDRKFAGLSDFSKQLSEKMKDVRTLEGLKTELEAGLGRLNSLLALEQTSDKSGDAEQHGSSAAAQATNRSTETTSTQPVPAGVHNLDIKFDSHLGKMDSNQAAGSNGTKKLKRYQMNPTKDWGPLSKARG